MLDRLDLRYTFPGMHWFVEPGHMSGLFVNCGGMSATLGNFVR